MKKVGGESPGRRRGELRQNLLLLVVSVFITLAAGEVAARLVLPSPLPWLFPQVRYRSDPDFIFAMAPGQRAFTADKTVRTNSRGLRGGEVAREPPPGHDRLLLLGDSIVFGYGIREEETLAPRIEARLRERGIEAEAINAGVPSYNTEQEVAFAAREGVRYQPDWVILGFCWNDINEKTGVQVSPEGWLIPEASAATADQTAPLETARGYALRNLLKQSRLAYSVILGFRAVLAFFNPDDHSAFRADVLAGRDTDRVRRGWEAVAQSIHRLRLLGEQAGFRTLIVAFPVPLALEKTFADSSYPRRLREIASQEGIPFLDLGPSFLASFRGHESLFIPYDGDHPNAVGHELAAQEIADALLAHGIGARSGP